MNAEVKAEWNFEQSFIKSNKMGSTDYTFLLVINGTKSRFLALTRAMRQG